MNKDIYNKMLANFDFPKLADKLSEEGITFADKQLKWDTAADGLLKSCLNTFVIY